MYIFNSSLQILLEFGPKMFLTDQRCFSRICFALSQLGFNIPPGFNIPLGFNIPVGSQVYRKIPVEIPLGFNIPAGSHRDLVSQWDSGGIPSGSRRDPVGIPALFSLGWVAKISNIILGCLIFLIFLGGEL